MKAEISKRKLESYKRAEAVARELRYQFTHNANKDQQILLDLLIHWMKVTGEIKYERPPAN